MDKQKVIRPCYFWGTICSGLLLQAPVAASAQTLESPKEFYSEGFVVDGSRREAVPTANYEQTPPVPSNTPPSQGEGTEDPPSDPQSQATATPTPLKETPWSSKAGVPVKSLRLLLASQDPKHFEATYAQVMDEAAALKLTPPQVFIVGDPEPIVRANVFSRLSSRKEGADVRYFRTLPEPFRNVQSSPTLAVETGEGVVLVEGFSSLRPFFNERGEFVAPDVSAPTDTR